MTNNRLTKGNKKGRNHLWKLRLKKGYNVEEASKVSGISISMLYELERGTRKPSSRLIDVLADTYGCTADEILGRSEK